jgi:dienelactone hydrolase
MWLLISQCLLPIPAAALCLRVRSFCWGGLYAVLLAQGQTPKVSAAGVYHGSSITPADVEAVTAPINFQQSDPALDRQIPSELYKQVWLAVCPDLLLYLHC